MDEQSKSCLTCRWYDSSDDWCSDSYSIPGPVYDLRSCHHYDSDFYLHDSEKISAKEK